MQRFKVDLKTFLGLAMPNQCCHVVTKYWFLGGILDKKPQTLMIPIYSTTALFDKHKEKLVIFQSIGII